MEFPSENRLNFWTVQVFKTETDKNFGFPHIPTKNATVDITMDSSWGWGNRSLDRLNSTELMQRITLQEILGVTAS